MKRTIIKIDENVCNGCGACVSGCHEGALQLINNKAVMVSELYCDGLGACIGECPVGAISLEEREAEPYNEEAVMERMIPKGEKVILAHLNHLKAHGEHKLLKQGLDYLEKQQVSVNFPFREHEKETSCCMAANIAHPSPAKSKTDPSKESFIPKSISTQTSELRQFPVQLHLLNPYAGFLQGAHLLLAADCTAFASGDFHQRFLKGKALAIACPKLDNNIQIYIDKLTDMIDHSKIETLTVLIMEVPCCGGLVRIAEKARVQAERNIPLKIVILSLQGEVKSEKWI